MLCSASVRQEYFEITLRHGIVGVETIYVQRGGIISLEPLEMSSHEKVEVIADDQRLCHTVRTVKCTASASHQAPSTLRILSLWQNKSRASLRTENQDILDQLEKMKSKINVLIGLVIGLMLIVVLIFCYCSHAVSVKKITTSRICLL